MSTTSVSSDSPAADSASGDLASRFARNPLIQPGDVLPSRDDLRVECLLNPGAFRYQGKIGLLVRVAEGPVLEKGWVAAPVLDPDAVGGIRVLRVRENDPELQNAEARGFLYQGQGYLTTLSHLRLAWSEDGVHFEVDPKPLLVGEGDHESFGIEDCRVEWIDGRYWLTYTAVSENGVAGGLISTTDWKTFERHGIIFPPHNKDIALLPEKVAGSYWALHRPSGLGPGGHYIWISRSPDLLHWGGHVCIAKPRPGMWDRHRIGAGAAPIRTPQGWLELYHGADEDHRYSMGALLLDIETPTKVLARSERPIMEPTAPYECMGFVGNVIFSNGQIVDGDRITMYYGASDSVVCGAVLSVREIIESLG
jgi:predicted GH43/DUF377 family glycosyl hydrolase